ncbi:MAG: FecR domain-containing protein [Betaproteobacteria bacterium]
MLNSRNLFFLAASLFAVNASLAQEAPIGYVKTTEGEASVVASGKITKAVPGTPIQLGNVLKTGKRGSMGVTFKDNTIMSLGPDTELTVDEYLYAPAKGDLKLGARIVKGTLNYTSGVIAKLKPEAIILNTPTGNIGVRGTHFVVLVGED